MEQLKFRYLLSTYTVCPHTVFASEDVSEFYSTQQSFKQKLIPSPILFLSLIRWRETQSSHFLPRDVDGTVGLVPI